MIANERERIAKKLKGWYRLTQDIERLQREISEYTMELRELQDKFHVSLVPSYEGLPHGSGISDKTGNLVASIVDKQRELNLAIVDKEYELMQLRMQLKDIENAVESLGPRDAELIRRYFLHNERTESIYIRLGMSKAVFYRLYHSCLNRLQERIG